ncbi:hypothetical protein ACQW02_04400 [Humitalea sp. 24SJ18S-53]|uniref:hypothetical protein n=1 Tax=Humitalea sp. 24SJ18S-53 TaxID=3422307 RepID=UPI003D6675DE
MATRLFAALLLCPAAVRAQAPAEPVAAAARVAVRVGDHPGFGRLVMDWPRQVSWREERDDGVLRLVFAASEPVDAAGARRPPRNIAGVAAVAGGIEIQLRPGAQPRVYRLGNRIVVDVRDPSGDAPVAVAALPTATPPDRRSASPGAVAPALAAEAPATPPPRTAARRRGAPPAAAPAAVATAAAPIIAPLIAATPAPLQAATVVAPEPAPPEPAAPQAPAAPAAVALRLAGPSQLGVFRLPATPPPGVAILRRGDALLVLLDAPIVLDLAGLRRDPLLAGAEAWPLPGAMMLRIPAAPGATLRAAMVQGQWQFTLGAETAAHAAAAHILLEPLPGPPARLALRASVPGRVVTMTDPQTGLPLLIGTLTLASDLAGTGVPRGRVLPQLEVLPTLLGAAVLARAETVTMTALTDRFLLGAGPGGVRMGPGAGEGPEAIAAAMTRAFDIPGGSVAALTERLRAQGAGLAGAAPLTRGPARLAAGETLLGLGQPHEAQAMLALALQEDPRAASDPRIVALHGAAALLAGRLAEAQGLASADLPPSDETTLWRAALLAGRGDMADAAPGFAATLPLLGTYPEPLRLRLLPLAAEALVEGGSLPAARRLLESAPDMPGLRLARARLDEAEGRTDAAIAGYAAVAAGRDRLARAEALRRSIDLRLASGALDAAGAAAALDASLFAWRGDGREVAARERLAVLRIQAGAPRAALTLLRETAALFPDRATALGPAMTDAFLAGLETEPGAAAIALFEVERSLLPDGPRGTDALAKLAGRLAALDLGDRAAAMLTEAMSRAEPATRAALGARLALLRLEERDPAGAIAALDGSTADPLPAHLASERDMLRARALARRGDTPAAIALLRGMGQGGLPTIADLAAEVQDWPLATESLFGMTAALPAEALDVPARRLVLRAAAAALLAGEDSRAAGLAEAFGPRMAGTEAEAAFAILTGDPAAALSALPRLTRELDLFRNVPPRLEALRTGGPVTR